MSFLYPIGAAILQAGSVTIDKLTLKIKNFNYKNYTVISFPLIFIFTLIIFFIFRPPLTLELFKGIYLYLIIATIILGIVTNIIFYKVLKSEHLGEIETITLLNRIPLIIFAGIFFASERNYLNISLAILAALVLVWSHWEKHHFHVAKKTWPFLIWTLAVSPFGGIISKKLLEIWNPISLHLVTSGAEAILFLIMFAGSIRKTPKETFPYLIATNILTTVAWILYFFSFQQSGIVFTVLVFSLQPFLVYLASLILLKEKAHKKKIIAFIVILASITVSQILK